MATFWMGVAMGGAAVVIAIVLPLLPVTARGFVYDYQTLIAGAGAIIAAAFAVHATRRQIAQQYELEDERRRRHNMAARAALPLALSELCRYAKECGEKLKALRLHKALEDIIYGGNEPEHKIILVPANMVDGFPRIPAGIVDILRECVASAEPSIAKEIWALCSKLQIQNGRVLTLREFSARERPDTAELFSANLDSFILDAAEVYARASNLFPFARSDGVRAKGFKAPSFRPSSEDMLAALVNCGLFDTALPTVWKEMERVYGAESTDD